VFARCFFVSVSKSLKQAMSRTMYSHSASLCSGYERREGGGALTGMGTQCKALIFRKRVFIEKKNKKL